MDLQTMLLEQGKLAKRSASKLATISGDLKNQALLKMAEALEDNLDEIIASNAIDLKHGRQNDLNNAMLDRLALNPGRIREMAEGIRHVVTLPDPIGEAVFMERRPNGLDIAKIRVPLGVIGIIYEARPNVTADAAALCLKSGNAVILRGGGEAIHSNRIITRLLDAAASSVGIPSGAIQMVDNESREGGLLLMQMAEYIDVLIPRGGIGLKKVVEANAKVPYIMTGEGNCHIYIDEYADPAKVEPIIINAKVQRPSVCNAVETVLVHEKRLELLPNLINALTACQVEIRACERVQTVVPDVIPAVESDWEEEYNDLILAIKVVNSLEQAIVHINHYGSGHSEAIITENYSRSRQFMQQVDAAAVYTNTSTRFTDGGEFGFGAEMGISTQKLHARGPMGLPELTTTKFMIYGDGQIRS